MGVLLGDERGTRAFTEDCLSCRPSSCPDPGTGKGVVPCSRNRTRIAHDISSWSFSHNMISSFLASRISSSVFVHRIFFFGLDLSLENMADIVLSEGSRVVGGAIGTGSRSKSNSSSSSSLEELPRFRSDSIRVAALKM